MKVFILFQTDTHRTRASRIFFGVFSTEAKAIDHVKGNGLYTHTAEVVIIENISRRTFHYPRNPTIQWVADRLRYMAENGL